MAQSKEEVFPLIFRNAIYSVTLDQNKFFFQNKVDCEFIYYNSNIKTFIYTAIIQKVGSW